MIQKLKRDNLYRLCIKYVSVYSCLLSRSYNPFSFFDTKIQSFSTKYKIEEIRKIGLYLTAIWLQRNYVKNEGRFHVEWQFTVEASGD